MKRLLNDRRGSAAPGMIIFLFVFILVVCSTMEYNRVHTISNHIEKELSRAANLAIESAMLDEYRKDGISRVDAAVAQVAFANYLHNEMRLNASNAFVADGKTEYRLSFASITVNEEPPRMHLEGMIVIPVSVFNDYIDDGIAFTIPFKIATRNQRLDV